MDRTNRRGTRRGKRWTTTVTRHRRRACCAGGVLLDPGRITEVSAALEPADFADESTAPFTRRCCICILPASRSTSHCSSAC